MKISDEEKQKLKNLKANAKYAVALEKSKKIVNNEELYFKLKELSELLIKYKQYKNTNHSFEFMDDEEKAMYETIEEVDKTLNSKIHTKIFKTN